MCGYGGRGRKVRKNNKVIDKGRPCNAMPPMKRPARELPSQSTCNCSIARKGWSAMQFTVQFTPMGRRSRQPCAFPTQGREVRAETNHIKQEK